MRARRTHDRRTAGASDARGCREIWHAGLRASGGAAADDAADGAYGLVGTLFARGTIDGAALIALVENSVFAQLPGLRVVVTAHAVGGLAMTAGLSKQSRLPGGTRDVLRKHVFIDTTLSIPP